MCSVEHTLISVLLGALFKVVVINEFYMIVMTYSLTSLHESYPVDVKICQGWIQDFSVGGDNA